MLYVFNSIVQRQPLLDGVRGNAGGQAPSAVVAASGNVTIDKDIVFSIAQNALRGPADRVKL